MFTARTDWFLIQSRLRFGFRRLNMVTHQWLLGNQSQAAVLHTLSAKLWWTPGKAYWSEIPQRGLGGKVWRNMARFQTRSVRLNTDFTRNIKRREFVYITSAYLEQMNALNVTLPIGWSTETSHVRRPLKFGRGQTSDWSLSCGPSRDVYRLHG